MGDKPDPYTSGHWFHTKPIDSVGPDEELINQVLPDGEELAEWETSPTPTLEQALCVMRLCAEDRRIPET